MGLALVNDLDVFLEVLVGPELFVASGFCTDARLLGLVIVRAQVGLEMGCTAERGVAVVALERALRREETSG